MISNRSSLFGSLCALESCWIGEVGGKDADTRAGWTNLVGIRVVASLVVLDDETDETSEY